MSPDPVFIGIPRFDSKVKVSETSFHNGTPCWEWQASKVNGYGVFSVGRGKGNLAHRYAYESLLGPIPDGLVIDHLCRNKCCINPSHLEPVSQKENLNRAPTWQGNRTHCPRGHEYTQENSKPVRNGKTCRQCHRDSIRKWRQKKYAARKGEGLGESVEKTT